MKPRPLALIAGAVFAVSFLLPAYADSNGFECFAWCWSFLCDLAGPSQDPLFLRLYYPAFVITNVAFVAVLVSGLVSPRLFRTRFFLTAAAFFHVLSWPILNAFKESFEGIQIGYYVWLLAYALLLASLLLENKRNPAA